MARTTPLVLDYPLSCRLLMLNGHRTVMPLCMRRKRVAQITQSFQVFAKGDRADYIYERLVHERTISFQDIEIVSMRADNNIPSAHFPDLGQIPPSDHVERSLETTGGNSGLVGSDRAAYEKTECVEQCQPRESQYEECAEDGIAKKRRQIPTMKSRSAIAGTGERVMIDGDRGCPKTPCQVFTISVNP